MSSSTRDRSQCWHLLRMGLCFGPCSVRVSIVRECGKTDECYLIFLVAGGCVAMCVVQCTACDIAQRQVCWSSLFVFSLMSCYYCLFWVCLAVCCTFCSILTTEIIHIFHRNFIACNSYALNHTNEQNTFVRMTSSSVFKPLFYLTKRFFCNGVISTHHFLQFSDSQTI